MFCQGASPKKIMDNLQFLFVSPYYKPAYVYGGPSRSIPILCEALAGMGAGVTVFTTNANGRENLAIPCGVPQNVGGVQVHYFERDLPGNYFFSRKLRQACHDRIRRSDFDLVYVASNWGYPFLPACRAALGAKIPYVITPRTSFMQSTWRGKYVKKRLYHDFLERPLINNASALHYTTSFEAQESAWLKLKTETFIVPNPVNLAEFEQLPEDQNFRRRYGIAESENVLLYLGRVEQRKGIELSLSAFARITDSFPASRFVIAGPEEDDYKKILLKRIAELNIVDRVIFTGYLNPSQRLDALVDANLFILTSYSENFGMSVVEAMAAGLPVVISDRVGLADIVQRRGAGLVVPLDIEKISGALIALLHDPMLCRQIGNRAKRVLHESYAPETVAHDMLREFDRILSVGKPI